MREEKLLRHKFIKLWTLMVLVKLISMISDKPTMGSIIQMLNQARRPKMIFLLNSLILLKITGVT